MKPVAYEDREKFVGGLNTRVSPDDIQINELTRCRNLRIDESMGDLVPRYGTRRMNTTALNSGQDIQGIAQWDSTSGKQLVCVAGGSIYYRHSGDYDNLIAGAYSGMTGFNTINPVHMRTMRRNVAGSPLCLYMVDGDRYVRWDGGTATQITQPTTNPYLLAVYHLRTFLVSTDAPQNLVWSVLGDPEDFTTGLEDQGGEALVDALRGDGLENMEIVGNSLVLATRNSLMRFTGYSSRDIQIQQDTEGIDGQVGVIGSRNMAQCEGFIAGMSITGPMAINEGEAIPMGQKIQPVWKSGLERSDLESFSIAWHESRREVWFAVTEVGQSTSSVYAYSLDAQAWMGPFQYPFLITCMTGYEMSDGTNTIVAGCGDGYVRNLDYEGVLDDVLADDTGGSGFTCYATLKPMVFDNPQTVKTTHRMSMQAVIPVGSSVQVLASMDSALPSGRLISGASNSRLDYRLDMYEQGNRLNMSLNFTPSSNAIRIGKVRVKAFNMQRDM